MGSGGENGSRLGTVKAAYDLYDLNPKKTIKLVDAMDGVEMMLSFVTEQCVQKEDGIKEQQKIEIAAQRYKID